MNIKIKEKSRTEDAAIILTFKGKEDYARYMIDYSISTALICDEYPEIIEDVDYISNILNKCPLNHEDAIDKKVEIKIPLIDGSLSFFSILYYTSNGLSSMMMNYSTMYDVYQEYMKKCHKELKNIRQFLREDKTQDEKKLLLENIENLIIEGNDIVESPLNTNRTQNLSIKEIERNEKELLKSLNINIKQTQVKK